MTDAEMRESLTSLRERVLWINRYIPRISIGLGAAALALTAAAFAFPALAIVPPLVIFGVGSGVASLTMGLAGVRKSDYENDIFMLASESRTRADIEKSRIARAQKAAAAPRPAQQLKEEFDAAISAMGQGIQSRMAIGKPLRLRRGAEFGAV